MYLFGTFSCQQSKQYQARPPWKLASVIYLLFLLLSTHSLLMISSTYICDVISAWVATFGTFYSFFLCIFDERWRGMILFIQNEEAPIKLNICNKRNKVVVGIILVTCTKFNVVVSYLYCSTCGSSLQYSQRACHKLWSSRTNSRRQDTQDSQHSLKMVYAIWSHISCLSFWRSTMSTAQKPRRLTHI